MNTPFNVEQTSACVIAIAAALKGTASSQFGDARINQIALGGEARFTLHYDCRKHVFHVSGNWAKSRLASDRNNSYAWAGFCPSELHPHPADTSVNISAGKSPEQIARDISRRFLPAYREVLVRCIARRDAHEAYHTAQDALAQKVADALGVALKAGDRAKHFDLPKNLTERNGYGSIEVSGDDSLRIELRNLEADKAIKIIAFLKTL